MAVISTAGVPGAQDVSNKSNIVGNINRVFVFIFIFWDEDPMVHNTFG
jgi:hypothetical protein